MNECFYSFFSDDHPTQHQSDTMALRQSSRPDAGNTPRLCARVEAKSPVARLPRIDPETIALPGKPPRVNAACIMQTVFFRTDKNHPDPQNIFFQFDFQPSFRQSCVLTCSGTAKVNHPGVYETPLRKNRPREKPTIKKSDSESRAFKSLQCVNFWNSKR
jgi:hypothetical protein